MPATESTLAETWEDWAAPGAPTGRPITRGELVAFLRWYRVGEDVEDSTVRYWERTGLLPRPMMQVRDGVYRPIYPIWAVAVIMDLRWHQQRNPDKRGAAWRDDLRGRLRRAAHQVSLHSGPTMPLPPPPVAMYGLEDPTPADLLTKDQIEKLAVAIRAGLLHREKAVGDDPQGAGLGPPGRSPAPLVGARLTVMDSQGVEMTIEIPLGDPDPAG